MKTCKQISLALIVTLMMVGAQAAKLQRATILGNADQQTVEALAIKLLAQPEVIKQKEESRQLLLQAPAAATKDGAKTLEGSLDAMVFAAAIGAANNAEPEHPKATVLFNGEHHWLGHHVPSSGIGFDNPDNAYRLITVDGTSKYEITLRVRQPAPKMYSIYLYEAVIGDGSKRGFDTALAGFRESEFKSDAEGVIHITLDTDPANGRPNHMQNPGDARCIYIRNMFDDWGTQIPLDVTVKRVGGPTLTKPDLHALAMRTAEILRGSAKTMLGMMNSGFSRTSEPNTMSKPFTRGGGWGYSARGKFMLAADEALLVTLETPPNQYLGFQVTDYWLRNVEYVRASGSLNNRQAEHNPDGSITYVLSIRDPGLRNWLDSGGLHEGELFVRWQDLPAETAASAVREVKLVKVAELATLLPAAGKVTSDQRRDLLKQRAVDFANRYIAK